MKRLSALLGAMDMTMGKPSSNLIRFSIPLLIGNFAQQLYNTVDSIVVGKYVGDTALAAVGASMPIFNLLLVIFMGIATGASIMVAQYFGAKQRDNLSHTVGTTLTLTVLTSVLIMIVGPLITPGLMRLLSTPADIYGMACSYLTIIFLGILGCASYNILSGVLRGLGDSISPLIFLLISCGLNIVLDIVFVAVCQWGVAGVAVATVIAQFVSAILCVIRLLTMREVLTINRRALIPTRSLVGSLAKLGLPSGITHGIFSMAAIVVQSLTNSFGTTVIACSTVVMRVDGFAMMPNFTFGNAMTTFTGQNMGASRVDRVEEGTRAGMWIGLIASSFLTLCLLFFGKGLMCLFTNTEEVIELGVRMIRILAVGYIAVAINQIYSGVMRGAGDTMTPMWLSLFTTVIVRVPIAYGLAYLTRTPQNPTGSPDSLFVSLLISWVLGAVLAVLFYKKGKWRKKSLVQPSPSASTAGAYSVAETDSGDRENAYK